MLGYALVWMVYLGSILVTLDRQHLRMDLLSQMLGKNAQLVVETIGALVFAPVVPVSFAIMALLTLLLAFRDIREWTKRKGSGPGKGEAAS